MYDVYITTSLSSCVHLIQNTKGKRASIDKTSWRTNTYIGNTDDKKVSIKRTLHKDNIRYEWYVRMISYRWYHVRILCLMAHRTWREPIPGIGGVWGNWFRGRNHFRNVQHRGIACVLGIIERISDKRTKYPKKTILMLRYFSYLSIM
jgi:hypothetical protein